MFSTELYINPARQLHATILADPSSMEGNSPILQRALKEWAFRAVER